jgi:soluble lytic murein transglycosylase-like protein
MRKFYIINFIIIILIVIFGFKFFKDYNNREVVVTGEIIQEIQIPKEKIISPIVKHIEDKSVLTSDIPYTYIRNKNIPLSVQEYDVIKRACEQHNIDMNLILAVIKQESNFNHKCRNKNKNGSTDIGIMQINNRYINQHISKAKKYFDNRQYNVYNKIDNIYIGIATLLFYRDYWINKGFSITDEELYLATLNSYNMGAGGFVKYYKRTGTMNRSYDRKITKYKIKFEEKEK